MANIFRVVKDKNYTIINNEYLKNKNLRVDSIGLLTVILSLPSDFNITMKGLISLTHQKANYRATRLLKKWPFFHSKFLRYINQKLGLIYMIHLILTIRMKKN